MDQILQRGRSAPVTHNRSFSLTLNQTQHNPLVRKDEPSLTSGLHVTSARLVSPPYLRTCLIDLNIEWMKIRGYFLFLPMQNQHSNAKVHEARPPPRFSKKVFQSNCNVAAAGDPRAKLGSYTQAYGTINKSDLDNLLRSRPYNQ